MSRREHAEIEVLGPHEVRLNGDDLEVAAGETPYDAAFLACARIAAGRGAPVLVHGKDRMQQKTSWFTVDEQGRARAADAPSNHAEPPGPPAGSDGASNGPGGHDVGATPTAPAASGRHRGEYASPLSFVTAPTVRPRNGLRGALYRATGGLVNMGPSSAQLEEEALEQRIARALTGSHNTAVLSLKGGIGKTSTTVGVGLTLARYRGDTPCAVDANPDSGDLAERALGESIYQAAPPLTISDVLRGLDGITSLTALSRYMHQAGRLHVLAGEQDPEISDSLTAEEWLRIHQELAKYYTVMLTDCGTGVTHNAMRSILQTADNLVIAAGYAVSGAKRARSTLLWLIDHGYAELARNAVVVVTDKDDVSVRVNKKAIEDNLSGLCRGLISVPHDSGVADGDLISLDNLQPATRRAYKEIAAAIVDGYEG